MKMDSTSPAEGGASFTHTWLSQVNVYYVFGRTIYTTYYTIDTSCYTSADILGIRSTIIQRKGYYYISWRLSSLAFWTDFPINSVFFNVFGQVQAWCLHDEENDFFLLMLSL